MVGLMKGLHGDYSKFEDKIPKPVLSKEEVDKRKKLAYSKCRSNGDWKAYLHGIESEDPLGKGYFLEDGNYRAFDEWGEEFFITLMCDFDKYRNMDKPVHTNPRRPQLLPKTKLTQEEKEAKIKIKNANDYQKRKSQQQKAEELRQARHKEKAENKKYTNDKTLCMFDSVQNCDGCEAMFCDNDIRVNRKS